MRYLLIIFLTLSSLSYAEEKLIADPDAIYATDTEEITMACDGFWVMDPDDPKGEKQIKQRFFTISVVDLKTGKKIRHQVDWETIKKELLDKGFTEEAIGKFHEFLCKPKAVRARPELWNRDREIPFREVMLAALSIAQSRYHDEELRKVDDDRVQYLLKEKKRAEEIEAERRRKRVEELRRVSAEMAKKREKERLPKLEFRYAPRDERSAPANEHR